jgi:hypothetical protein
MTRSTNRPAAAALTLGLLAAGCAAEPDGHTFETVVEADIPIALNSATPRYPGEIFAYEKVVEIRADADNFDSQLYQPRAFTLGSDGRYYVADTYNHRVAIYDATGAFVGAIGREGDGPGELHGPILVEEVDGVLIVTGSKTSRFTLAGEFIDSLPGSGWKHRTRDGLIVTYDYPQGDSGDGIYTFGVVARIRNSERQTVASVEIEQGPFARIDANGTRHEYTFGPRPFVQYVPSDEIVAVSGRKPEVDWYGLDGVLRRRARIALAPPRLTAPDRALANDHFDRLIQAAIDANAPDLVAMIENRKSNIEFADPKAFWGIPIADGRGWVWLRESVPTFEVYRTGSPPILSPQSFRVLDQYGEYVGDTNWPSEVRGFASRVARGHLLAMVPDPDTGETIPTAYRIATAVPGLNYP